MATLKQLALTALFMSSTCLTYSAVVFRPVTECPPPAHKETRVALMDLLLAPPILRCTVVRTASAPMIREEEYVRVVRVRAI